MNICMRAVHLFLFLLGVFLGVEMLDHMEALQILKHHQAVFQTAALFCISASHMWGFQFLHILANPSHICPFNQTILVGVRASLVAHGKESACSAGGLGSIPGSGRSPGRGNGNPLQCSCLENPMLRGDWRAAVPGAEESTEWMWNGILLTVVLVCFPSRWCWAFLTCLFATCISSLEKRLLTSFLHLKKIGLLVFLLSRCERSLYTLHARL